MKPNTKQKKVTDIIKSQASFWNGTNDISSPTHWSDIDEETNNAVIFGEISESEAKILNEKLCDLFAFIKTLDSFI